MRKTTQKMLKWGLAIVAMAIAFFWLSFALGLWVAEVWGQDAGFVVFICLLFAFVLAVVLGVPVYVRMIAHRSWRVNRARYPEVAAAIERYREKGEAVRPVLPAFLIDGRRYFIVKYLPKNAVWENVDERGVLVVDEHGRVQDDEALFPRLLRLVRFVEESTRDESYLAMEQAMAVGPRLEREIAKAREAFSTSALAQADGEWMPALEAFWDALSDQVEVMVSRARDEHEWRDANRKRVEFTLEEMMPLVKALEEASARHIENAGRVAQTWAKVEGLRARLEDAPRSSGRLPRRLRRFLDAFGVSAAAASDAEQFRIRLRAERWEAYRSRTAKALQLERQTKTSPAQ